MAVRDIIFYFADKISIVTIALLCIILTIYVVNWFYFRSGTPPGPWGIPLFGYFFFLKHPIHKQFVQLSKKYGDVFSMQMGTRFVIVLNSYKAIREAFVKNGPAFEGKPFDGLDREFGDRISVAIANGQIWRDQRRFLLSALRDFGFGKAQLEENIRKESQHAIDTIVKTKGRCFEVSKLTRVMTGNIMGHLVAGRRFTTEDNDFLVAMMSIDEFVSNIDFVSIFNSFPFLIKIFPRKLLGLQHLEDIKQSIHEFTDKIIKEHEETYHENVIRDVIDVYLMKRKHHAEKNKVVEIYSENYLKSSIATLMIAGTDTSSTFIAWSMKLLAKHEGVQKRMQKELDEQIGTERFPGMSDRSRLPYCEAVILELMRYLSVAPAIGYHRTLDESTLFGYRIPKGAHVIASLWSIHNDPEVWKQPEIFQPERFLDEFGKVNSLKEQVLTFSIGKRNCLGESLARMEIFMFITALVQKLNIRLPENQNWTMKPYIYVPMLKSKEYEIRAELRHV